MILSAPKTVVMSSLLFQILLGKDIQIKSYSDQRFRDLKRALKAMLHEEYEDRDLYYAGKHLTDESTIASYDIADGAILEQNIMLHIRTVSGRY